MGEEIDLDKSQSSDSFSVKSSFFHQVAKPHGSLQESAETSNSAVGVNQAFVSRTDYDKLCLSLLCGLPNEQELALNVCTILSNEGNYMLHLEQAPKLVDLLVAQTGIFPLGDESLKMLYLESWKDLKGRNMYRFWRSTLDPENSELMELLNLDIGDYDPHCKLLNLEGELGAHNVEGQRVLRIALILHNLSFEKYNVPVLVTSRNFMRFVLVCVHSSWGNLKQVAYDTLSNLAGAIKLSVEKDVCSRLIFRTVVDGILSLDRYMNIRSMDILAQLCSFDSNEDVIPSRLEVEVYQRLVSFLTVRDIMLLFYTLEALYALSDLGRYACDKIVSVHRCIGALVSLLTLEPTEYGPSGQINMKVVKTLVPADADSEKDCTGTVVEEAPSSPVPVTTATTTTTTTTATSILEPADSEGFAMNWLKSSYEHSPGNSISRNELYSDYLSCCTKAGRKDIVNANVFAEYVKKTFPMCGVKKCESRGIITFHHDGIQKKGFSKMLTPVSKPVVNTPPPKVSTPSTPVSCKPLQKTTFNSILKSQLSSAPKIAPTTPVRNPTPVLSNQKIQPSPQPPVPQRTVIQSTPTNTGSSTLIKSLLASKVQQRNLQQHVVPSNVSKMVIYSPGGSGIIGPHTTVVRCIRPGSLHAVNIGTPLRSPLQTCLVSNNTRIITNATPRFVKNTTVIRHTLQPQMLKQGIVTSCTTQRINGLQKDVQIMDDETIRTAVIAPSQTAVMAAPQTAMVAPSQASIVAPSQTTMMAPSQASIVAPSQTTMMAPSQTAMMSSSQTGLMAPPQTTMMAPSQTTMMAPSQTAIVASSQTAMMAASQATVMAASQTAMVASSQAAMVASPQTVMVAASQAAMMAPPQTVMVAASQAAVIAPPQTAIVAASQAAVMTPQTTIVAAPSQTTMMASAQLPQLNSEQNHILRISDNSQHSTLANGDNSRIIKAIHANELNVNSVPVIQNTELHKLIGTTHIPRSESPLLVNSKQTTQFMNSSADNSSRDARESAISFDSKRDVLTNISVEQSVIQSQQKPLSSPTSILKSVLSDLEMPSEEIKRQQQQQQKDILKRAPLLNGLLDKGKLPLQSALQTNTVVLNGSEPSSMEIVSSKENKSSQFVQLNQNSFVIPVSSLNTVISAPQSNLFLMPVSSMNPVISSSPLNTGIFATSPVNSTGTFISSSSSTVQLSVPNPVMPSSTFLSNGSNLMQLCIGQTTLSGTVEVQSDQQGVVRLHIESPENSNQGSDLSSISDITRTLECASKALLKTNAECNTQVSFSGACETPASTTQVTTVVTTTSPSALTRTGQQFFVVTPTINQPQLQIQQPNFKFHILHSLPKIEESVDLISFPNVSISQSNQLQQPSSEISTVSTTSLKRPSSDTPTQLSVPVAKKPCLDSSKSLLSESLRIPTSVPCTLDSSSVSAKQLQDAKSYLLKSPQTENSETVSKLTTPKTIAKHVPKVEMPSEKGTRTFSGLASVNSSHPSNVTSQVPHKSAVELEFLCEWKNCGLKFKNPSSVFLHATKAHAPLHNNDMVCLWEGCDSVKRRRLSLLTHLQDWHCNESVLQNQAVRRKQLAQTGKSSIPPPQKPPPHPGYAPDAALLAIKRHALQYINPKELSEEKESVLTKSIRLTSALILRNLVTHSTLARTYVRRFEPDIAYLAMSPVESARTLAQCLSQLYSTHD